MTGYASVHVDWERGHHAFGRSDSLNTRVARPRFEPEVGCREPLQLVPEVVIRIPHLVNALYKCKAGRGAHLGIGMQSLKQYVDKLGRQEQFGIPGSIKYDLLRVSKAICCRRL